MKAITEKNSMGFEICTCSRCGGTGQHSYCQAHGTRCFGCGGSGVKKTKRGIEAYDFFHKSMEVPVESLEVGDLIFEWVGMTNRKRWQKIEEIDFTLDINGYIHIQLPSVLLCCDTKGTKEMVKSQAEFDKHLAAALEYQDKLTKAGKLMKKYQKKESDFAAEDFEVWQNETRAGC